jgi:hypothetical protein
MGTSQSVDSGTIDDFGLGDINPYPILLLSRVFKGSETCSRHMNPDNLYLNDYGDEPDPEVIREAKPKEQVSPGEVDDYPINTMALNVDHSVSNAPNHDLMEIRGSFENAREKQREHLDKKYRRLPHGNTSCSDQKTQVLECYRNNPDISLCKTSVDAYSRCAKSYSYVVSGIRQYFASRLRSIVR